MLFHHWTAIAILQHLFREQLQNGMFDKLDGKRLWLRQILDAKYVQLVAFHIIPNYSFEMIHVLWMHIIGAKGTRICGSAKIDCYKLAEQAIFGEDVIEGLPDENAKLFRKKCNCLSACTSIEYDTYIDRANHDVIAALSSYQTPSDQYLGWDWLKLFAFIRIGTAF